jgi:hypothetical protein
MYEDAYGLPVVSIYARNKIFKKDEVVVLNDFFHTQSFIVQVEIRSSLEQCVVPIN